jgi:hypothetical protein
VVPTFYQQTTPAHRVSGGAAVTPRSRCTPAVRPESLGARGRGPGRVAGWLCPACRRAAETVGSADSVRAVECALSTFLGVSSTTASGEELWVPGLQAWGGAVLDGQVPPHGILPNATPWDHLSRAERDDLAAQWRRGG